MPEGQTSPQQDLTPYLGGRSFDACWDAYQRDGYVVFPEIMPTGEAEAYRAALTPFMKHFGRNDFEGEKTNRVYGLLAKSPLFVDMIMHPLALAFAEKELGASFLLSAALAINLKPGETVQPWHTDDGYVSLPHSGHACSVSAFWTIDETTEANGATEVLPGSHNWLEGSDELTQLREAIDERLLPVSSDAPAIDKTRVKVAMPAGSLMLTKGTLWHRGGANTSTESRLIVTPQYCAGWMRQIENMMMSVPPDIAKTLPQRLRELLGYSVHPPFIGYVDGMHPERTLT